MENGSSLPTSSEKSSTEEDKTKTTAKSSKSKGFEALLPNNRQRDAEKIAQSLDRSPLFDRPEKPEPAADKEFIKELPETIDDDQPEDETAPEEDQAIIQQFAAERYDKDEPVEAVREFYEELLDGEELEAAYQTAQQQNELPAIAAEPITTRAPSEGEIQWRRAAREAVEEPDTPAQTTPPTNYNRLAGRSYYYENWGQNNGFLAGTIVGDLIGRRRGRLNSEKKAAKVRKKLTTKVEALQQQVTDKEILLRQAADEKPAMPTAATEIRKSAPVERTQPGRNETRLGLEKPARAERLGHMIVAAQNPETERETKYIRPNNIRQAFRPEEAKTMPRRELLELSDKIVIEGASLRHIYESHLIGEKQLRHLVGEYLEGKEISRDLRKEMIEREIDFERDPILRDRVRSQLSTSNVTLNQMLAKAGALPGDDPEAKRHAQAQAARDAVAARQQNRRRQAADTAMITAIVVLAVTVFLLLMRR